MTKLHDRPLAVFVSTRLMHRDRWELHSTTVAHHSARFFLFKKQEEFHLNLFTVGSSSGSRRNGWLKPGLLISSIGVLVWSGLINTGKRWSIDSIRECSLRLIVLGLIFALLGLLPTRRWFCISAKQPIYIFHNRREQGGAAHFVAQVVQQIYELRSEDWPEL